MNNPEFREAIPSREQGIGILGEVVSAMITEAQTDRQTIVDQVTSSNLSQVDSLRVISIIDQRISVLRLIREEIDNRENDITAIIGYVRGMLSLVIENIETQASRPLTADTYYSQTDFGALYAVQADLVALLQKFTSAVK